MGTLCTPFSQGIYNLKVKITIKSKHSRKQNIIFFTFLVWFPMSPLPSLIPGISHKTYFSDYTFLIVPLSYLCEISLSETMAMSVSA